MPAGASPDVDAPPRPGARVGILGGTFDPVHVGHLVAATWARDELSLDRVLLVVANDPWQKSSHRQLTAAEDRLAVVAAAVEAVPGLEASRMEIDRGGPSYTVDTVRALIALEPDTRFHLLVGADVASELDTWHEAATLASLLGLVIVDRGGVPPAPDPPGWRIDHLRIPAIDISSSELRGRMAAGRSVDYLIPEPAIRCIFRLGLYAGGR